MTILFVAAWSGPWELALSNEVSLRELVHPVTKECSGSSEVTLGLSPLPSMALCLVISGMCWVRWPENGVREM